MLARITATAGSLGLMAAATAAQAQTTGKEIFTPVQDDLALVNLRKLLGCVVDGVWTAATCADDRPLTVALGYFNVGCLIVSTILACYLLYSLVADTANDGQAFGRDDVTLRAVEEVEQRNASGAVGVVLQTLDRADRVEDRRFARPGRTDERRRAPNPDLLGPDQVPVRQGDVGEAIHLGTVRDPGACRFLGTSGVHRGAPIEPAALAALARARFRSGHRSR